MEETQTLECLDQIKRVLDNNVDTDQMIISLLSIIGRVSSDIDEVLFEREIDFFLI